MPSATSIRQPSYRHHKPSGQAVVTLGGKDIYLGRYGTEASRRKYDRVVAEWLGNGRRLSTTAGITVAEVIKSFWAWVEMHYRHSNGLQTSEVSEVRYSLRPLNHLFGTISAAEFGPLKFKAVRQLMIDGYEHPKYGRQKPLCRGVINNRMERIKRMFRWATENELLPPSIYHGLISVRGLQRGRTKARETEPITPVPDAFIEAIRPFVSTPVEAIIDLQLLTGARPGEICVMRACDLDMGGRIWIYRPVSHKNEHRGHQREIYLGPRAQAIVKPFFKMDLQAYLFSPRDAEAERLRIMRANRKTKVQPSQACRKKKRPSRSPGDHYDVSSYRRAITRACAQAFPLPEHIAKKRETIKEWHARLTTEENAAILAWRQEHSWHPHQLRHNAGTNVRKEFGVEVARIILGHATAFTTEIYAETDRLRAMEAIGKIG